MSPVCLETTGGGPTLMNLADCCVKSRACMTCTTTPGRWRLAPI